LRDTGDHKVAVDRSRGRLLRIPLKFARFTRWPCQRPSVCLATRHFPVNRLSLGRRHEAVSTVSRSRISASRRPVRPDTGHPGGSGCRCGDRALSIGGPASAGGRQLLAQVEAQSGTEFRY
jgi:hypothetical protein